MSPDPRPPAGRLKSSRRPLQAPPDVPEAGPLRELKRLLFTLYLEAGSPSYESIAAVMAGRASVSTLSAATIGRYLAEPDLPSDQQSTMMLAAVLAGPRDPDDVRDEVRKLWLAAKTWVAPGTPIAELTDPMALDRLDVRRAISVSGGVALPLLPPYIERAHDVALRDRLTAAVQDGRSAIAVVVGGSAAGKTRTCWEVLHAKTDGHQTFAGWRLWHPFDPTGPEALLAGLEQLGRRTVVWLDETQHYLLTEGSDLGERVAARVRRLLTDPEHAPVVVLGTMWPEHWETLTTRAARSDPHAQARQLLAGTAVGVPSAFDEEAVRELAERADTDPRLREAATRAADGEITQYLAGGPALLERYELAPAAPRAVLDAAIDLRRLGHGEALPQALLNAVAATYPTERAWRSIAKDPHWFRRALDDLERPVNGDHSPLTRIRPRRGEPDPLEPSYRLDDYLDYVGRARRRRELVPADFWTALATEVSPANAAQLGEAAADRLLYACAVPLLRRAALAANPTAACKLADLLTAQGDLEDAAEVLRAAAAAGDVHAVFRRAELLVDCGDVAGADAVLQPSVDQGDVEAALCVAWLLGKRGDLEGLRSRALASSDDFVRAHSPPAGRPRRPTGRAGRPAGDARRPPGRVDVPGTR